MSLTPAELAAARAFRAARRDGLDRKTADITASVFVRYERHDCARRGGKSVFLELKEHYAFSPAYVLFRDGQVLPTERTDLDFAQEVLDDLADAGMEHLSVAESIIPARRFAWIWTEGRCPACGLTARSATGRLVDPAVRPPAEHAILV
jgi:hypothetical protein